MKGYDTSNGYMGMQKANTFYLPVSKSISSLWKIKGGKIMFGFDKMFDFNRDGKLDSWERAAQFQFMDEMMKDDEKSIFGDDDEIDAFVDAGLDYDELEFMDPDEFDF